MLIAKFLLRDLCSDLGPYCTNYVGAKRLVFSDTVTYGQARKVSLAINVTSSELVSANLPNYVAYYQRAFLDSLLYWDRPYHKL